MTFELPQADAKPAYVKAMFDRIAARYDLANDVMTLGHHRAWKGSVIRHAAPKPGNFALDLATGTGDIARRLKQAVGPDGRVWGLDFSPAMLLEAKARGLDGIEWVEGDMLELPFPAAHFDVVTVGFGLRNVADVPKALLEVARVLKPGGRFVSLDLARPRWGLIRPLIDGFSFKIVPLLGRLISGDGEAYSYLPASNETFLSQDELAKQLGLAGFEALRVQDLLGGATAIVSGVRSQALA
jgi:demethylmenaquinone methyltransferase/2-methoxy-6-polyprenyl-1,4-benzoquinol methylase